MHNTNTRMVNCINFGTICVHCNRPINRIVTSECFYTKIIVDVTNVLNVITPVILCINRSTLTLTIVLLKSTVESRKLNNNFLITYLQVHTMLRKELDSLKTKHKDMIAELKTYKDKVSLVICISKCVH